MSHKKLIAALTAACLTSSRALAEEMAAASPQSLFSWGELGTLAGATAATLLIVQFAKLPLDKVWKIPTRLLVLVVAFLILLGAQAFTAGLSPEALPLIALNSFLVAAAAMGAYEVAIKG